MYVERGHRVRILRCRFLYREKKSGGSCCLSGQTLSDSSRKGAASGDRAGKEVIIVSGIVYKVQLYRGYGEKGVRYNGKDNDNGSSIDPA